MNKIKFYAISFDFKVKVIMAICIIIAIIAISYNCYNILINVPNKNNESNIKTENITLEDIINLKFKGFDTKYKLIVYSNKTENEYEVEESVDYELGKYSYYTNNGFSINKSENNDELSISNDSKVWYRQLTNFNRINYSSLNSVLNYINNMTDKDVKIENDNITVNIYLKENIDNINKIKKVQLCKKNENCKNLEIKMYNTCEKLVCVMILEDFVVKK